MSPIYIAAPIAGYYRAIDLASRLRAEGFPIVSTWHDRIALELAHTQQVTPSDPDFEELRAKALSVNLSELVRAELVIALVNGGTPRATFGECGFALALKIPVVWVEGAARACLFDSHSLSVRVRSEAHDAILDAIELARARR